MDPDRRDEPAPDLDELILGHPLALSRGAVTDGAGVSLGQAQRYWHALGFPVVADDEPLFSQRDIEALARVTSLVSDKGVSEDVALAMTRALARTTDRLAVWQTQLLAEACTPAELEEGLRETDARAVPNLQIAQAAAAELVRLADDIEPLLVYAWRRHLSAAVRRMLTDAGPGDVTPSAPPRVVGFADLVNFTSLVRRMTERQLGVLVQRFEALASDIVTAHGGRVIKTVGDEVLFVHVDPAAAAATGLDLVQAMAEDRLLPDVRVGLAYGAVVSRLGDVFGTTVNRASRLTSVTPPGRVYVDDAVGALVGEASGFETVPQRRRTLRGIGTVVPREVRRRRGPRGPGGPGGPGREPAADV